MNEVERLLVRLMGDSGSFEKMIQLSVRDVQNFTKITERETKRVSDFFRNGMDQMGAAAMKFGGALTAVGATFTAAFGLIVNKGLNAAGAFEQTNVAFTTMLGSAETAKTMLADLTEFAALTPFEMPEIEQAARGLVMFGERGDELMETMKILGNAASGTSSNFGEIALIFNQIRGVGKLLTQDFRQLSTRGVLSLQDIAKHFGVTTEEAQNMLSGGKIKFNDVRNILKGLSEEGGRFANMMEKQSKTFNGLKSTLSDAVNITIREFGQVFLPLASKVVEKLIQFTEVIRNLSPGLKQAIAILVGVGAVLGTVATLIGGVMVSFGGFVTFILPGLMAAGAAVATVFGFIASLGAPVLLLVGGFSALTAAFGAGVAALVDWKGLFKELLEGAKNFALKTVGFFANLRENVGIILDWIATNWADVLVQLPGAFVQIMGNVAVSIIKNVKLAFDTIIKIAGVTVGALAKLFVKVFEFTWVKKFVSFVARAFTKMLTMASKAGAQMAIALTTGKSIGDLFGEGFDAGANDGFVKAVKGVMKDAIGAVDIPDLLPDLDVPGIDLKLSTPFDALKQAKKDADGAKDATEGASQALAKYKHALAGDRDFDISAQGLTRDINALVGVTASGNGPGDAKAAFTRRDPFRQGAQKETREQLGQIVMKLTELISAVVNKPTAQFDTMGETT